MISYQVRAEKAGRIICLGFCTDADPGPVALSLLGPAWWGGRIGIEAILPRCRVHHVRHTCPGKIYGRGGTL